MTYAMSTVRFRGESSRGFDSDMLRLCTYIFDSWQEFDTVAFLPDDSGLVAQFGNSGLKIHSTRYFLKYYIKTFLRFLPFFGIGCGSLPPHPAVILPSLISRKKTPSKVLDYVQDP
jgi:hypothetical protein